MRTNEILRSDWQEFFDSFSQKHRGSSVTLEILGPEIGAQVQQRELAFAGIVADTGEIRGYQIAIMMGDRPDDHITHSISQLSHISLEQTDEGNDVALAIKSADGVTALLRFTAPQLLEKVDVGVVPSERPPL
jgi:hypothetical protein